MGLFVLSGRLVGWSDLIDRRPDMPIFKGRVGLG